MAFTAELVKCLHKKEKHKKSKLPMLDECISLTIQGECDFEIENVLLGGPK